LAHAGHFVQEHGRGVAEAALAAFGELLSAARPG
jgi:hypothetical protein